METSLSREKGFPDLLDSPGEDGLDGDDAPAVIMDVLVDTLLSLLPQSSAPMRTSIELVFKYFCDDIADDGLLQMLMVIKKNLKHARHKKLIGTTLLTTTMTMILLTLKKMRPLKLRQVKQMRVMNSQMTLRLLMQLRKLSKKFLKLLMILMEDGMMIVFQMNADPAQICKAKKNVAGADTAHHQLMLFKLRVLSLLEIYLYENPGKCVVLKLAGVQKQLA
ncbi:PREDICTED: DNA polymerase [Prunus dulcis]|uniref:PREDICTED: DNA polymerase n=1 Tax=Prunus dulcis TaxID=3755 RepID=A0A5E4F685_PRUDU|nr:PREDICTED: DNA polymerase [Prunus dulcis]